MAMASYARQAKDETLRKYADRIKARAIARCGELLRAIPPANGERTDIEPQDGSVQRLTREQAARDAGLSERQRKTALRVANVPTSLRDELIESEDPPTITELAELGKQSKNIVDLGHIHPSDYVAATRTQGLLRDFATHCEQTDPVRSAKSFQAHELNALRRQVSTIDSWLDSFIVHLGEA